jgi:ferredoxin
MMSAATAAGAEWQLSYGGRTLDSMAFVPDLSATYGPRVSVHPQDSHGLLDLEALLGEPQPETFVYCCGPGPLLDAVESLCTSWPGGTLHVERFTPKMVDKPAIDLPFEVEIVSSGQIFTVPTDQTLLEVLRDNGVVVESSCEEGTCGSCETAVVDGAIDHRDSVLTDEERGEGKLMMVCVSRAACPRIVLDL